MLAVEIVAEVAAQIAGQFLLCAILRCLCSLLHGIPPSPLLGMSCGLLIDSLSPFPAATPYDSELFLFFVHIVEWTRQAG